MAMRDLINGVKPTSRTFTFDNFYKDTKAVFEGTERPKGKPDYTSYSGSEYWYGEDKGGKYVVRGSDHWSGEFKVKDGERTNVLFRDNGGRNAAYRSAGKSEIRLGEGIVKACRQRHICGN